MFPLCTHLRLIPLFDSFHSYLSNNLQRNAESRSNGMSLNTLRFPGTQDCGPTGNVGTIFLNDNVETWKHWLNHKKELFDTLDPLDPTTHEQIADVFGVLTEYKKAAKAMVATRHHNRTLFLLLVSLVQHKKRELAEKDVDATTIPLNVSVSFVEGNHRQCSQISMVYATECDTAHGIIRTNSLSKDWIAKHLIDDKNTDITAMTQAMENASGSVLDWVGAVFENPDSMYRKKCTVVMHYGKPHKPNTVPTKSEVEGVLLKYSTGISKTKRNSSSITESQNLAGVLRMYVDMLDRNSNKLRAGHHPTFSRASNFDNYRANCPKEDIRVECGFLSTPTFRKLISDPGELTLADAVKAETAELGVRVDKANPTHFWTGKFGTGPFFLTDDTMFHLFGEWNPTLKTYKTGPSKPKHTPLGVEEWNMSLLMCLVFPIFYRIHHNIHMDNWDNSRDHRETCARELRFILRSQIGTMSADTWGKEYKKVALEGHEFADFFDQTPLLYARNYWAAAIAVSGMIVSLMYVQLPAQKVFDKSYDDKKPKGGVPFIRVLKLKPDDKDKQNQSRSLWKKTKKYAMRRLDTFISAIACYNDDSPAKDLSVNDKDMLAILGTCCAFISYVCALY